MKRTILMLMAVIPALLFAQTPDNFTVKGKVSNWNAPARAYLIYEMGGKNIIDSTVMVNGEFTFHGHIGDPASAYVVMDPTALGLTKLQQVKGNVIDAVDLYIEPGTVTFSPADSISKAQINGSKLNDDNKRFKAMLAPFIQRAAEINMEFRSAPEAQQINPVFVDTIQAHYRVVQHAQTEAIKKFVLANQQSFISLVGMRLLIKSGMTIADMEKYFNGLSPAVKQTELGKGFGSALADIKVTAIGSVAPDFTQADVNGTPVSLTSLRGKYVLIDFWASWCGPCRQENPHVVQVFNKYKAKNFTILGVSLDKPTEKEAWLKAIKDDGLAWTQVSDLKEWSNAAALLYNVSFIPQNFLIDPQGKIVGKNLRGADLDSKMVEIFKM